MTNYYTLSLVILPILTILYILKHTSKRSKSKLPPGPKQWPIIGNIHQLGNKPHCSVAKLAETYGPIMSLKLGTVTTIVISSSELAKEMFLKHDLAFSSRKVPHSATVGNHHMYSIAMLPVCPRWRDFRKIAAIQVFTNKQLDASKALRQKNVNELVEYATNCCKQGSPIDIGKAAFTTTLNLLSNTFFSIDLASHVSSNSRELKDLIWDMMEKLSKPNVSDFFPFMKHFDVQGIMKGSKVNYGKMMRVFEDIIDERLRDPVMGKDDVLATLLHLEKENELNLDEVKHILMDLFVAGTDTTSSTLEWAMTELLRNPDKLAKAQDEKDKEVNKDVQIQESDISKLPYIQAVVKETLRLHPPVPFLIPHMAAKDVHFRNYFVPKNSQIWVNVWSMGRDPSVWPNSHSFSPERFVQSEIDMKGRDFELIPFGAGRRVCPGMPLAHKMLHLMLATLLHSFNWKPTEGVRPGDIDVDEKFGITLQKLYPLQLNPILR